MAQTHLKVASMDIYKDFPWAIANAQMNIFTSEINKKLGTEYKGAEYTPEWFFELCERIRCKPVMAINSIGTLGGGNHFIEFSTSQKTGNTGVTVHSGSRNLGLKTCNYWQRKASENMKQAYIADFNEQIKAIKADWPQAQWNKRIMEAKKPPTATGLEYLEGEDMYGYLHEMNFAQIYAHKNVLEMMSTILQALNLPQSLILDSDTVHTTHNYIDFNDFIIRKGAVASYKGQRMLIPFNMEDGILVCEGKSNENWYKSAPHGAGRIGPRKAMKRDKSIDVRKIRDRMNKKGIYLSKVPKDEVREAYKDPAFIEEAIAPTATIVDRLKPVLPLKAED